MAISQEHRISTKPNINDDYPLIVTCSCQWQGLATGLEHAEALVSKHAQAHAGHRVIIEKEA